jgi:hypothetical protein
MAVLGADPRAVAGAVVGNLDEERDERRTHQGRAAQVHVNVLALASINCRATSPSWVASVRSTSPRIRT